MTIAILCPTRSRPEQCRRLLNSIEATSIHGNVFPILGVTAGDATITRYGEQPVIYQFPDMLPTAQKWNELYEKTKRSSASLFMLGSDDMVFETAGWDKAMLDHYNALENKVHVYALQDSRDENGTPHPIVTREYIEAMGYFVPPIFLHWYVDGWTVEIAKANGCFTHMKDYMLVHDKPSDRGQGDETHNRIRAWGWHERDAYVAQTMAHVLEGEKRRLSVAMNARASSK